MLTRIEKNILAVSRKFVLSNGVNTVNSGHLSSHLPKYSDLEIYLACKELNKNEYFNGYRVFLNGDFTFSLSNKGLCHKEISLLEVKSFFFRSVFTPILVSATTTFIIWLVQNMWL